MKKFGGTSVGSVERIEHVADRLTRDCRQGQCPVVVVSAMSGETNRLIDLANQIYPSYRGAAYDLLVASGEQVSTALLSMALTKRGFRAEPLLAFQLGIKTDSSFSKARIQGVNGDVLRSYIEKNTIPIVAGFQGVDRAEKVTTLGRGGSDTTAVAVSAALGLESCEIYTDVPCVFSADPRLIDRAREIQFLGYEEMLEMSALGSKVLHGRSVELAAKNNIKIHLRSTFEEREGTWIIPEGECVEQALVTAITHDESLVVYQLDSLPPGPGFPAQLFSSLSRAGVVVDIISQSQIHQGLSFSTSMEDRPRADEVLSEVSEIEVKRHEGLAKLSAVGFGMVNNPGAASKFFAVLSRLNISTHLITTSEIKISAVIEKSELSRAASALHTEFGLDDED